MDPQKLLQDALTQRLRMQIALSSMPVVEEWMDAKLSRWLESIPTPMEMRADGEAHLSVSVGSDLQSLRWGAYGSPPGFIPKLAKYLEQSGSSEGDLARINSIGEAFEPTYVGSWCAVVPETVTTGWQFRHLFPVAELWSHLGSGTGAAAARELLDARGLDTVSNIGASLGDEGAELRAPLASGAEGLARSFGDVLEGISADPLADFLAHSRVSDTELVLGFSGAAIESLGIRFGGIKSDDVASLCRSLGATYETTALTIGNAVGSDGIVHLEVRFRAHQHGTVELGFRPGDPVDEGTATPVPN